MNHKPYFPHIIIIIEVILCPLSYGTGVAVDGVMAMDATLNTSLALILEVEKYYVHTVSTKFQAVFMACKKAGYIRVVRLAITCTVRGRKGKYDLFLEYHVYLP